MKPTFVKADFSKLDKFIKGLESRYAVDVGIFGARNTKIERDEVGINNAELGFIHEFGRGVPVRSFLRMPLQVKSNQILKEVVEAGAVKKMSEGNMYGVLSDLGIACEKAIAEAFDSSGYGDWKPNKKGTTPLVDTGQLRRSVASAVVALR